MDRNWMTLAADLNGPRFAEFHTALAKYNASRFDPGLPEEAPDDQVLLESRVGTAEVAFVGAAKRDSADDESNSS